jgi:hypothetical protein
MARRSRFLLPGLNNTYPSSGTAASILRLTHRRYRNEGMNLFVDSLVSLSLRSGEDHYVGTLWEWTHVVLVSRARYTHPESPDAMTSSNGLGCARLEAGTEEAGRDRWRTHRLLQMTVHPLQQIRRVWV